MASEGTTWEVKLGTNPGGKYHPSGRKENSMILTIADLNKPELDHLTLVTDSQDTKPIQERFNTDLDGFFVAIENGDYIEVYGFYGIVPVLSKRVYTLLEEENGD